MLVAFLQPGTKVDVEHAEAALRGAIKGRQQILAFVKLLETGTRPAENVRRTQGGPM
jgi:hypothetical protein